MSDLRADRVLEEVVGGQPLTFHTTWGLFSPKAVDHGTRFLAEALEVSAAERILDVGCGYGPLGLALAARAPAGHALLVDKDFVAVEYAAKNAGLNGLDHVSVRLSNGLAQVPERDFTLIAANLPAKVGNELLTLISEDAHDRLQPGGRYAVVVIGGLREHLKRTMKRLFGNVKKLGTTRNYTGWMATRES